MRVDERLVRMAASALPPARREARLEEWLADLEGGEELGVSRSSVTLGAVRYAITENSLRGHLAGVRPRTWLISGLATLGIIAIGVPGVAIAAYSVNSARGIVTIETGPDGSEQTVFWRDYPGIADLDSDEVLAGPSLEEGLRDGEAMVAEIRQALSAELGLEWTDDPNAQDGVIHPAQNWYGGQSMLSVVNAPGSQSTSVPRSWDDKQRAIEIIGEVTARYGFGAATLDQDRWPMTEEDRIRDLGGATPETQVLIPGISHGPTGQWLFFSIQDLSNDVDGRIGERIRPATDNGWEPNTITLSYGANGLLPEVSRAEFERRLEPFAQYEKPAPQIS